MATMNPPSAAATASSPQPVPTFKFFHGDDIRRWTPTVALSFAALASKASDLYGLSDNDDPHKVLLKYEDPEGDRVTLACESDLHELLRLKLPLARVFLQRLSKSDKRLEASSESETEDGHWTSKRLDKYLSKLNKHLAVVSEEGTPNKPKPFRLVKILARGFDNADEEGRKKIVDSLKESASSSAAVNDFLTKVAYSPSELGLNRRPIPVSARNLAGMALSGQAPALSKDDMCSDSETEDGKWRPQRLEKYLSRLSECLSQVTDETPCSFQLVRLLMKGAMKADEASGGMEKVVATLQEAAEANPSLKNLLSQVAMNPSELGLRRNVPFPARALAAKALGRTPSTLPGAPTSSSVPITPGPWMRGGGRGRGFGSCPRGRGGRWRMLNEQEKPHARLVSDVTVPDETRVAPGQIFTKIWCVANSGELPWDPEGKGLLLLHVGGDSLGAKASTPQCLATGPPAQGETTDLAVEMRAPMAPGRYEGFFRLARAEDEEHQTRFGQRIWARVVVTDDSTSSPLAADQIGGAQPLYPAVAQPPPSVPSHEDNDGWVDVKSKQ